MNSLEIQKRLVEQWYESYDEIGNLVVNNFKEIPLIKTLNEMDSDYTELMYVGIGRYENSTTWEWDYNKIDIPGFTNFYE